MASPRIPHHTKIVKSWPQLVALEKMFSKTKTGKKSDEWIFRGQNTAQFPMTSLERHLIENFRDKLRDGD